MKKYIIHWNIGYGDEYAVVEADNLEAAKNSAYESARESFENEVDYSAQDWTQELEDDYI